jgi:trimeric autotransporter adhesin
MKSLKEMHALRRVATVTVTALTFGLLSASPSNAVHNADTFTIDAAADTVFTGESATAVVSLGFLAANTGDTLTITASTLSLPAGAVKLPTLSVVETTSAQVAIASDSRTADVASTTNSLAAVSAKLKVTLDAPTVPGTYVMKLTPSVKGGGGVLTSSAVTWTVTVNAVDLKASAAYSTSIINAGENISATTDAVVFAPKTVSADAAAVVVVTQKNAINATAAESLTVTVAGAGMVGTGANQVTMSALGRAITVAAGNYIGVFADGTSGVSTITVATQSGVVLATEKVTFYGDIATIKTTVKKQAVAVGANADVISAVAYDAAGVTVGSGTLYATSADTAIISNVNTAATIVNGEALFALAGVKTGTAKVAVTNGAAADTATVRVEGAAAAVKLSFDKASYTAGEAAVITVAVVDANGLVLSAKTHANALAAGGIATTYTFGASSDTLTATAITTDVNGVKTYKVYMPLAAGAITITATGGTDLVAAGQVKVSASATVVDKGAEALAAITALAATVATLRTLIVTLTNLVLKIQKKVKA